MKEAKKAEDSSTVEVARENAKLTMRAKIELIKFLN